MASWALVGRVPPLANQGGGTTGGGDQGPTDPGGPVDPGGPPDTGIATTAAPWLPYDLPTDDAWAALGDANPVAIHYMVTQRRRIQNKNIDTDATAYEKKLQPPGQLEGATDHRPYGGLWHDWPEGVNPGAASTFELDDKIWELRRMKAAGFRHVTVDILGSDTFKYALMLAQAASVVGGIKLIAMPDCSTSIPRNGPVNLADYLEQLFTSPFSAVWQKHTDGRWLVMPYGPELVRERVITLSAALTSGAARTTLPVKAIGFDSIASGTRFKLNTTGQIVTTTATVSAGATSIPVQSFAPSAAVASGATATQQDTQAENLAYWQAWRDSMTNRGLPAALWPCYTRNWLDATQNTFNVMTDPALANVVIGEMTWGTRNPVETESTNTANAGAIGLMENTHKVGSGYTFSAWDARPNQSAFQEPDGARNLLSAYKVLRDRHPDWSQYATYNDRAEGTAAEPSHMKGNGLLDILGYLNAWYRFGKPLPIERDGVYVIHRPQQTPGVTPQPTYTAGSLYTKRMARKGATLEVNKFSLLVFAKEESQVQLTLGGALQTLTYAGTTGTTVTVPAGLSHVQAPLKAAAAKAVVATIKRGGATVSTCTSPWAVNFTTQLVQTLDHYVVTPANLAAAAAQRSA